MKIYQPMLFVGLGGTGGRIGAELERGLRRELCGPDGTALTGNGRRNPFQLPECLQFVYADFSEGELAQLPHLSARGPQEAAFAQTARAIHDLLPADYDSSPEVTRMLRVALHEETQSWLPPQAGQPRVAPLHNGAGQLPTVGRAALFATLRNGLEPVLAPLREAVGAIAGCAGDLADVGGKKIRGCDVFVAFSVAGGTGAGIYYDFLHLIGHEFHRSKVPGVKIYPLVVMPSAFPPESGGGREAELNASRALVDLSRLVDNQNVPDADSELGHQATGREAPGVHYPERTVVRLRASTVQTAFLFSRPAGIRAEDLRRSITAMVLSLIGTELGDNSAQGRTEGDFQSFAASFVNKSVERSSASRSGIGHRGMSTSLAASLSVPVDELAEIVSGRLLAAAVEQMDRGARRPDEQGTEWVRQMFLRSGIGPLWTRDAPEVPAPDPLPRGGKAISTALRDRIGDMEDQLAWLDRELDREVLRMVDDFKPGAAVRELLGTLDPFQLGRVLTGTADHPQRVAEAGFVGMLENRRNAPERPEGIEMSAPHVPRFKRTLGVVPARWGDPDVQAAVAEQDAWFQWQVNRRWHRSWKDCESRWRPVLGREVRSVTELGKALGAHREEESRLFAERRRELYRDDRTGVCYLLPPQNSLRGFYDDVFSRLREHEAQPDNQNEAGLLATVIERDNWQRALSELDRSQPAAVKEVKQVVEQRVKRLFVETSVLNERPLLPSLGVLLRAAAGDEEAVSTVDERWLEQFRNQLAGLLPVGFTPDGNGPLKVLILHPQSEAHARAEGYLRRELNLPRDSNATVEFRAVSTDSITVVLFRSGMSLTDVSEVRQVLRLWAESRDSSGTDDFLDWRQRLGYGDDWLASTEDDRRRILHRMLCAMWNQRIEVAGDPTSPDLIRIRLQDGDAATMTLPLEAFDEDVSSWAGLLRAYEQWALLDEGQIIEDFCHQLMQAEPEGVSTTPVEPAPLFHTLIRQVAPDQIELLRWLSENLGEGNEKWLQPLLHFWEETLPGALDLPFPGAGRPVRPTLRALYERRSRSQGGKTARPRPRRGGGEGFNGAATRRTTPPDTPPNPRFVDVTDPASDDPDPARARPGATRWTRPRQDPEAPPAERPVPATRSGDRDSSTFDKPDEDPWEQWGRESDAEAYPGEDEGTRR